MVQKILQFMTNFKMSDTWFKIAIIWFGMTQGIHRHKYYNFLTDCSKVICENVNFWYVTTHRWRCSQLWQGPSDHGVDEAYQVTFRLNKVWPRYSLWTNFGSTLLSSHHHNFWTKMNKKNLFSHFCAAQSKDHLSQFWEELDQFWRRSSEKTIPYLSKWPLL